MIKKVTTGKHKGQYSVRIQPVNRVTGKRESWPLQYVKTLKSAKTLERKMWADFESGYSITDANSIFSEAFANYVEQRKQEQAWSPVTYKAWLYSVKVVREYFGQAKIRMVTQRTVNQFAHQFVKDHHSEVRKTTVIGRRLSHMRHYFKTIEGTAIIENPVPERALHVFFRKSEFSTKRQRYIFSDDDLSALKTQLAEELKISTINNSGSRLAIWIDLETGMRPGEIQALRFENLVVNEGFPTFKIDNTWSDNAKGFSGSLKSRPRGAYRYCLPISDGLADFIRNYEQRQKLFLRENGLSNPKGLIFLNLHDYKTATNEAPINQRSLNQMLCTICTRLGIDSGGKQLSMYSFRHTACTKLANKPGISYPWAAERMGHTLQVFMSTYVSTDRDRNRQMMTTWLK